MATSITRSYIYSYSYSLIRIRTADLCYRLSNTRKHFECYKLYSEKVHVPVNESDELTVMEVRKLFKDMMGVKPVFKTVEENRSPLLQYLPESQKELPPRSVKDSIRRAIIPLRIDTKLQERYVNVYGQVRKGRLMEDMDMFAAWVAINYVVNPKQPKDLPSSPYIMTTIMIDHITFTEYVPRGDMDIRMNGHVSYVGKTSVEVTVWVEQNLEGSYHEMTKATFLMASRNANLSAGAIVNSLVPADVEEKLIVEQGENRKRQRGAVVKESILAVEPLPEEQQIIHNLFLESIDTSFTRRILPPGASWMGDTVRTNNIYSFTEDRNFHNTVFGGFLIRHAVEMSWLTGYFHSKLRPRLRSISNIHFKKPVPLGSIICYHGKVTYTEANFMQIFVHGDVKNPFHAKPITSLLFTFTYECPDLVGCVIPNSYYEAMMYIDGRRRLRKVLSLLKKQIS